MTSVAPFLMLAALLPLVGSFHGRTLTFLLSIAAWAAFGVAVFFGEEGVRLALAAQAGLFVFSAALSFYFVAKLEAKGQKADVELDRLKLDELKAGQAALKEAVSLAEREEIQSMQIYVAAKGLAEALTWKDMAPRLTSGVQKIFGAFEFLLYSISEQNRWTLLHRRGNWAQVPPLVGHLPSAVSFIQPPETTEPVPILSIPVFLSEAQGQQRLQGVLFIKSWEKGRSEPELLSSGQQFGEQLGMAIKKAQLFTQMELQSLTDGLTGVMRRQPFMDRLQEELKRAAVFHTEFSVLMVDIDHFKFVNDTYGHAAGDAVLKKVGHILRESFYETDVVGRYGGEEFIVLLPRAQAEGVMRKAEALRQRLQNETIVCGFNKLQITVSIGLSHFPEAGRTAEGLIAKADQALYRAKETGRNRVVAA